MFSLFLRPISPHDVQLYALCDEIKRSKRFYLSPFRCGRNPCGFLLKILFFRFFYRRKSPLPYNCTATLRFSTLLHLFYLPPSLRLATRTEFAKMMTVGVVYVSIRELGWKRSHIMSVPTAERGFVGHLPYRCGFTSNTLFTKKQLTRRSELNIILRYDGIDMRLRERARRSFPCGNIYSGRGAFSRPTYKYQDKEAKACQKI